MDGKTLKLLPCNILDTGFWILCDSTKLNRPQRSLLPNAKEGGKTEANDEERSSDTAKRLYDKFLRKLTAPD
jgi:hypothetical protein